MLFVNIDLIIFMNYIVVDNNSDDDDDICDEFFNSVNCCD